MVSITELRIVTSRWLLIGAERNKQALQNTYEFKRLGKQRLLPWWHRKTILTAIHHSRCDPEWFYASSYLASKNKQLSLRTLVHSLFSIEMKLMLGSTLQKEWSAWDDRSFLWIQVRPDWFGNDLLLSLSHPSLSQIQSGWAKARRTERGWEPSHFYGSIPTSQTGAICFHLWWSKPSYTSSAFNNEDPITHRPRWLVLFNSEHLAVIRAS